MIHSYAKVGPDNMEFILNVAILALKTSNCITCCEIQTQVFAY